MGRAPTRCIAPAFSDLKASNPGNAIDLQMGPRRRPTRSIWSAHLTDTHPALKFSRAASPLSSDIIFAQWELSTGQSGEHAMLICFRRRSEGRLFDSDLDVCTRYSRSRRAHFVVTVALNPLLYRRPTSTSNSLCSLTRSIPAGVYGGIPSHATSCRRSLDDKHIDMLRTLLELPPETESKWYINAAQCHTNGKLWTASKPYLSEVNPADSRGPASEYWRNAEEQRSTYLTNLPHRSRAKSTEEARTTLTLEIDAVTSLLCSLRTRYNTLAPVSYLPTEVLAHIFEIVEVLEPPFYDRLYSRRPSLGWLRATHVCRQWRSVALGHPYLWSDIVINFGTKMADTYLQRSRMYPVVLSSNTQSGTLRPLLEAGRAVAGMIKQHMCHIRKFSIVATTVKGGLSISPSLSAAAPVLEDASFTLSLESSYRRSVVLLPLDLFGHVAPRLRSLQIQGCNFSWPSLAFESLIHLYVLPRLHYSHVGPVSVHPPPCKTGFEAEGIQPFLDALSRMPALKTLDLQDAVPCLQVPQSTVNVHGPPISLPNLQFLGLVDDVDHCFFAPMNITIPPTVDINITCRLNTAFGLGSSVLLPWLTSSTAQAAFSGHVTLHPNAFRVLVRRQYLRRDAAPSSAPFPSSTTKTLRISNESAIRSAEDYFMLFGACRNVRHLVIPKLSDDCLWAALTTTAAADRRPLFPALARLTFECVTFEDDEWRLDRWLAHRQAIAPLRMVEFVDCDVGRSLRSRIRSIPGISYVGLDVISSIEDS
ncbi:hypothetical protein EVG20_g10488 [Dentipellis fragilis]|uniref:F-box domain-containing protein n=1 Tax=Dentipellis fragilis TaxID=205917 RepID=A0A4Y9XTY2_9AGAM|nr:hypothetical protein EVG20_g10488 [Dentipellis fragilis]